MNVPCGTWFGNGFAHGDSVAEDARVGSEDNDRNFYCVSACNFDPQSVK